MIIRTWGKVLTKFKRQGTLNKYMTRGYVVPSSSPELLVHLELQSDLEPEGTFGIFRATGSLDLGIRTHWPIFICNV